LKIPKIPKLKTPYTGRFVFILNESKYEEAEMRGRGSIEFDIFTRMYKEYLTLNKETIEKLRLKSQIYN